MTTGEQDLEGKVAIVTGAAGGIGSETAAVFAAAGAKVVLADLPGTTLEEVAKGIEDQSNVAHHIVDISDEDSVRELIAFTVATFGKIDVLHNNAARQGLPEDLDIMSMSVEIWDSVFAVNARGCMLMCKHALGPMIESGGGSIVNMSSETASSADMQFSAYAASKGAINSITLYVATQYAGEGVRCNAISPSLIRTPMLESVLPEPVRDVFVASTLVPRLGEPRDVAELVRFLASDRASFITGQNYRLDGGFLSHVPSLAGIRALMVNMAGG